MSVYLHKLIMKLYNKTQRVTKMKNLIINKQNLINEFVSLLDNKTNYVNFCLGETICTDNNIQVDFIASTIKSGFYSVQFNHELDWDQAKNNLEIATSYVESFLPEIIEDIHNLEDGEDFYVVIADKFDAPTITIIADKMRNDSAYYELPFLGEREIHGEMTVDAGFYSTTDEDLDGQRYIIVSNYVAKVDEMKYREAVEAVSKMPTGWKVEIQVPDDFRDSFVVNAAITGLITDNTFDQDYTPLQIIKGGYADDEEVFDEDGEFDPSGEIMSDLMRDLERSAVELKIEITWI